MLRKLATIIGSTIVGTIYMQESKKREVIRAFYKKK